MGSGFVVRYGSRRALKADFDAYLTHGGLIIPEKHGPAPDPSTPLMLRLEVPEGPRFSIQSRVGNPLPGRGFMVIFEATSAAVQEALADLVESAEFRDAAEAEGAAPIAPPQISSLDEDDDFGADSPTDPGLGGLPSLAFDLDDETQGFEPIKDKNAPFDPDSSFDSLDLDIPSDELGEEDDGLGLHPDIMRGHFKGAPRAAVTEDERHAVPTGGTVLRKPSAGETYQTYVVKFISVTKYLPFAESLDKAAKMKIPYADSDARVNDPALLRLKLPGNHVFNIWSVIEKIGKDHVDIRANPLDDVLRKAVVYRDTIGARARVEAEKATGEGEVSVLRITEVVPEQSELDLPLRRKLQRMGMDEKINLAQSGNKEERIALAMDSNKAIHHYLLKNAKVTLDEIAFMARLPSLNPDVLDKIAENPSYTQNPSVAKALVYNPKTPVRTAIRILDRLPRSEVMNLAKRTGMNLKLVMAAKKKIEKGFKG